MTKSDFRTLANMRIQQLTPYEPGKPIELLERELGISAIIKLASNENPLGPGPQVCQAIQSALAHVAIYPDGNCYELKQALSQFLSLPPELLTIGNGSENILELIVKAYLSTGDNAVISQYAFQTIPLLLKSYGIHTHIAAAKNFTHNPVAMLNLIDKKTRVLFFVNPNNPTGTYTSAKDFASLMKQVPGNVLVVVDEAYCEYITVPDYPNTLEYLSNYPNLVITRTFSKIYGLAGLRLGYAVSSPDIADILNRARLPFNVNAIAAKAGCAALADQNHIQQSILQNQQGMRQLELGLSKLKISYIPSVANFITIQLDNAAIVYQQLLYRGIIVRPLHAYQLNNHLRITVGTEEQNNRVLEALQILVRSPIMMPA